MVHSSLYYTLQYYKDQNTPSSSLVPIKTELFPRFRVFISAKESVHAQCSTITLQEKSNRSWVLDNRDLDDWEASQAQLHSVSIENGSDFIP